MARVHLLLCFTLLFASVTLLDVISAHLNLNPALPQIEEPKTVNDVEGYTVKVVMVFVSDLEKQCPKTSKFKMFFEKLRAYAKYVCPIKRNDQKDYDQDMKAKAGGLFKAISSFAIGKIKAEIEEEKQEAINTFKWMRSVAGKILGGRKKEETEATMTLTAEQQKEIKEGILKWQTVIARIANTMVTSTSTTTSSSSTETSTTGKGSSNDNTKSSGSESSYKDTTGSNSNSGSPSGSPSGSNSPVDNGAKTSSKDTTGGNSMTSGGSRANSQSEESTNSASSSSVATSQNKTITVTEVEDMTSKQVMAFIMNLEKKCPPKEEYKAFLEKLKSTMMPSSKVQRKGLFARIKSAAGKVSGAMSFILSRIGSKSAEVKKSMEAYQAEVMKSLQELDAIHSKIISQNQSKKGGSLTCSPEQQQEIQVTITKWEQVTTQFVETAIKSESSSTSSSSSSSSSVGKLQEN